MINDNGWDIGKLTNTNRSAHTCMLAQHNNTNTDVNKQNKTKP